MTLKILITGGKGNIAKIIKHNLSTKYDISAPSKLELNLLNYNELKDYLNSHNFDILIHTAITGGRRTKIDTSEVVYSNLLMMENILLFADRFKMIINLDSAAIYDRNTDILNRKENDLFTIPTDFYGFSKYMIFKRTLMYENVYHLRIFNLFHDNEEPERFIKTCRLAKAESSVVTILEDKYFDFFSAEDFIKVLEYYLTHSTSIKEKVINLCYEEKYKLSDIAKMIQPDTNLINVIGVSARNYTGDGTLLKQLGLDLYGLKHLNLNMINVCIIGTGNIGTDLLYKLNKLKYVNIVAFIGRSENKKQLPYNVKYSNESIQYFIKNPNCCDVVFDCTDAQSAIINNKIFIDQGIKIIDLTPSNTGSIYIPRITSLSNHMNMVTCGGQASIPLINFIYKQSTEIKYVEVVTQISAESAGMATRINIDKYIETTENTIYKIIGLKNCKVILNVNPSKNVTMNTTIYIKTDKFTITNIDLFLNTIKSYIPNYYLSPPVWMNDNLLMLHIKIIGSGDYISQYAGNLDIINCAAIEALKSIYT